jgi:hypothetical protein
MRMGRTLALAQSALGRMKEVSRRITQILDTKRERENRGWRPALAMIGTLSVVTVGAMPYAPELISFQNKSQPVFSAASDVTPLPIKATPVVFRQPVHRTERSLAENSSLNTRAKSNANVIPAKAITDKKDHTPKVMMAKASDRVALANTFLVWRSSQFDQSESSVWTLTVWRFRSANGGQQMVQETIVMNSL